MLRFSFVPFARLLAALAASLAFLASAPAQLPEANGQLRGTYRALDFDTAVSVAAAGDFDRCEKLLFQGNRQKPNTLAWQLECAYKLASVATAFRQRGDGKLAALMAQRALAVLGDTKAKMLAEASPRGRSSFYEFAGAIYEDHLGNFPAAQVNYEQALRENPASSGAKAGLARLTHQNEQADRLAGKKG